MCMWQSENEIENKIETERKYTQKSRGRELCLISCVFFSVFSSLILDVVELYELINLLYL